MKRLVLTLAFIAILFSSLNTIFADEKAKLEKGTFILVNATKILSTETLQEGDLVYFISPADVWVDETKIIPKDTIFTGYVEMLKMPIKGINAAIKFKITHITLPNGETKEFSGKITDGKNGAIAYDGNKFYKASEFPAEVRSTLGAGDAFSSTFVASMEKTDGDIEKSIKMASVNSASCVEVFGAQEGLIPFPLIEEKLKMNPDYKVEIICA